MELWCLQLCDAMGRTWIVSFNADELADGSQPQRAMRVMRQDDGGLVACDMPTSTAMDRGTDCKYAMDDVRFQAINVEADRCTMYVCHTTVQPTHYNHNTSHSPFRHHSHCSVWQPLVSRDQQITLRAIEIQAGNNNNHNPALPPASLINL